MSIKLTPLPGRILIKEDEFVYSGKLTIPEHLKRRPSIGTIIAIGVNTVVEAKVGDRILYPMYSGTGLRFRNAKTQANETPMRVLVPEEILCLVEGDDELLEAGA